MARSPYQGTFQQGIRPTVVTAPDALVYINGEVDVLGCSKCKRRFDWNRYITSIQVDTNVDSPPGTASINLSVPRHSVDEFYFEGEPLITPMMEVEIFAKGYYLVEGVPQYYPIFWGLVTEVSDSYSGGEHTFSINCADILKWWELCKMNVNPAFTAAAGQGGRSIFGNVFFGMNPYDVIWTLAQQSFGDVVVGTGSLTSLVNEQNQNLKSTFRYALGDIMQYWNERFSKIRSNLLLYGTTGNAVRGDVIQSAYQNKKPAFGKPFASQLVRQANGGTTAQMDFDPADPSVVAFRTQGTQAGQVNFWQTEYQTKLELANAAKEAIGFEFYMDVTGDIVFKPPFYNLDILSNKPVSWIQDIDVIDWDFSDSEAEVVTQIQLQGNYTGNIDWGMPEEATPYTSVTDYHLLRKYGWRSQTFNSEFLADPKLMFYVGLDLLDRYNSKRHRGTVNIPLRPELRLGFPIYIAPKDQIWYVQGISHNISYGSRAVTTVTLTAKRSKFLAPKGIGTIQLTGYKGPKEKKPKTILQSEASSLSARQLAEGGRFKADVGDAAQLPPANASVTTTGDDPYEPLVLRHPKTGRIMGYPNVVMAYTRPFNPTPDELSKLKGEKRATDPRVAQSKAKASQEAQKRELQNINQQSYTFTSEDAIREKHLTNRYAYGINSAGVYTYLHDTSKVISEMILLPAANITFNHEAIRFSGQSGMIRPVSDERGFEVIGHHRYGRGVSLRDGALVLSKGSNAQADVGVQLALSGGLYETLQAQSQGLTTITTAFANPADTVARLAPDDLQTASAINPETKKPEFVNDGTNFIDSASLNSPERAGAVAPPNVEAAQLSRALTLAEIGVRESTLAGDSPNATCECVTGRSDLAFINIGYQIQVLRPSTSDVDLNAGAKAALAEATAIAEADPLVQTGEVPLQAAIDREVTRIAGTLSPDESQALLTARSAEQAGEPEDNLIGPQPGNTLDRTQMVSKVERFLATLYSALDEPHQQYEKELRGELIPVQTRTPTQVRFENAPGNTSNFTPPYSTPSRAIGGDPEALAIQAKTASNNIAQAWDNFGGKLKAQSQRTQLQAEISRDRASVSRLEQQIKDLETAQTTGTTVFNPIDGDIPTRINALKAEVTTLNQDISSNEVKLSELNQKFPP